MNYKKLLLVAIMFLFPITVNADSLKLTKTLRNTIIDTNDYIGIINNYDNNNEFQGLILIGNERIEDSIQLFIQTLDKNNNITKTYNKSEIIVEKQILDDFGIANTTVNETMLNLTPNGMSDGIIAVANSEYDDIKWYKQFGGSGIDLFLNAFKSYTNKKHDGYIVMGITFSTDIEDLNPGYFAIKYDLNGNEIWKQNILESVAIPSYNAQGKKDGIVTTESGNLNKINTNLENIFNVNINGGITKSVTYLKDSNGKINGYITVGVTCSNIVYRKNDIFQRRLDNFANTSNDRLENSNNIQLMESCNSYGIVTKYDLNGKHISEKVLKNIGEAQFNTIIESKNPNGTKDGYIILGAIKKENTSNQTDGLLLKLDKNLNIIQKEIYEGGAYQDQLLNINESINSKGKFNGYNIVGVHSCYESLINSTSEIGTIKPLVTDQICSGDKVGVFLKYTYPEYEIKKNIDNGGTVTIDETAMAGSVVYMKINLEPGYELKEVIVTDEKGNKIEVKNNSFIMPEGKVNIEVKFKRLINPNTVSTLSVIVLLIMMTGMGISITKKKTQV